MLYGLILYLIIIILLFIGCRPSPGNPDYLSRQTSLHMRGVCSLMVMLGHLIGDYKGLSWFYGSQAGTCGVAVFFFLSGYGLIRSMNGRYMQGFLKRKFPKLWIPMIILTVVYYVVYNYLVPYPTDAYSGIRNLVVSLLHGDMIVSGSWYIVALSWLYLAFYGAYRYTFGRDRKDSIIFVSIIGIAYLLYLVRVFTEGSGFMWVFTPHMFIVGLLWGLNEEKILKDKRTIDIPFVLAVAGIVIAGMIGTRSRGCHVLGTVMYSTGFAFVMLFISRHLRIGNRITAFIGRNSFGIYLTHQLIIYIVDRMIEDTVVWLVVSIAVSIAVGCFFDNVLNRLYKRIGIIS